MDWYLGWEAVGRVVVGALLGAAIGLEREVRDHPAGLRTHATVAIGAAVFGVVSTLGFDEVVGRREDTNIQVDVTRVASQVVVGIGFLGAGLIFRRGGTVRNLTTAATLWATAAAGLAAGVGDPGVAVVATLALLVVLSVAPLPQRWLVRRFGRSRRRLHLAAAPGRDVDDLRAAVDGLDGVSVERWRLEKHDGDLVVDAVLAAPADVPLDDRLGALARSDEVGELRPSP